MADVAELKVRLTADASGLKAGLVDVQAAVQRTGGVFATLRENITPLNQGIELLKTTFNGLIGVGERIARAFEAPIAAAAEQDRAIAGLEATLSTTNQLTAEYASNLGKLADAEALVKNVQDDVVLGAERTLIAFGAQRDQLPKLVDAVVDLGTKTGDIAGAAFIVGKAIQGETGTLSRYGIFVDDAASKTDKLDSALEQIQARFGGQAAAAAATFSGRIGIVGIAFQQLQERIGAVITQNPVVLTAISGIAAGFTAAKDAIEVFLGPLEEAVSGLVALATVKIADSFTGLADAAKDVPILAAALRAFADGLRNSNTAALQAKANLAGISETVAEGARGAARFIGIIKEVGPSGQLVFRTIGAAIIETAGALNTLTDSLANADTKLGPLETIGNKIGAKLKEQLPAVEDAFVTFAVDVGEKMAAAIGSALVRGVKNAFTAGLGDETKRLDDRLADLNANADRNIATWKRLGEIISKALTPAEAGAAEIPTALLPPDTTAVENAIEGVRTKAIALDLTVKPLPFTVPQPPPIDLPITPILGPLATIDPVDLLVTPILGPLPTIDPVELPVTPRLQAIPTLPAIEVAVTPNLKPLPALDPISVDVTPILGPLKTLASLEIAVTPRLAAFPPLPVVDLSVTPRVAPIPPLAAITLDVLPRLGPVPPLAPVDLPVTPVLGPVLTPAALTVAITPRLGILPTLAPLDVAVRPILAPLPALAPIDVAVTPELGPLPKLPPLDITVTPHLAPLPSLPPIELPIIPVLGPLAAPPPVPPVSAPLDFDPSRALSTLAKLFGTAEATAAEIPTAFLPPPPPKLPELKPMSLPLTADNTSALATINATQADAQKPLTAKFDIDTTAADASTAGFFSRLISGMAEVALKAGQTLLAPVTGLIPSRPTPAAAAPVVAPTPAAPVASNLEAQLATQKQITDQAKLANDLESKRAALIDTNKTKLQAEFEVMAKGFEEQNPTIKLNLDTTEAKTKAADFDKDLTRFEVQGPEVKFTLNTTEAEKQAAAFDQELARFKALNPEVTLGFNKAQAQTDIETIEQRVKRLDELEPTIQPTIVLPPNEAELKALEDRVARLDNLKPTISPTIDLTLAPGATLDDMIAKAREINSIRPNLQVELGKSFEESQASITELRQRLLSLNEAKPIIAPTVDLTQPNAAFTEAKTKAEAFQAIVNQPAATITVDTDTAALTPATKQVEDFKTTASTPIQLNIDTTKAQGQFTVMQSTVDDVSAKAQSGFHFSADISNVKEKLGIIRTDISAGVDPITITAEAKQAQKVIDDLKAGIKTISDTKLQAEMTLKVDDAQTKLDELKTKIEQPATKPVDADTQAALAKVAELQARAEAAVAAVAHGFGAITGPVATSADIQQTIDRLRDDLVAAIKAGDQAAQVRLRGAGLEFVKTFGPTGGITAAERKQIQDIVGPFASISQARAQQDLGIPGLGLDPGVAAAMRDVASTQKQDQTNSLLRENNDVAKANLAATKAATAAFTSGNARIDRLNAIMSQTALATTSLAASFSKGIGPATVAPVENTVRRTTGTSFTFRAGR